MKILSYTDIKAINFDNNEAKGVAGRVLIGKKDGANNFCMRIFEVAPGGHTPKHSHAWEHEMFIHAGTGEIYCNDRWTPVSPGHFAFIPANEKHQIKNSGNDLLKLICLVPAIAPEI